MKIVEDFYSSDYSPKLPPSLKLELEELEMQAFEYNQPVVHQLKSMMQLHPEFPEPGCLLVAIYDLQGKKKQSLDLLHYLNQTFKNTPAVLTTLGEYLIASEDLDEMEQLADFALPFEQQFPDRELVAIEEWLPYELISAEWLILNDEIMQGINRIKKIAATLEVMPRQWQDYKELIELIEEYIDPDEYDAPTHELLQILYRKSLGEQYISDYSFIHPELFLLQRALFSTDIHAVMNLLKLPRVSLLADLRLALQDLYQNDFYYRQYSPPEIQPDLPIAAFLLLAELEEPDALKDWLYFLHQPIAFIEFWMEDLLNELGYWISWKLGRNSLTEIEEALRDTYENSWSAVTLATGLIITYLHEEDKKQDILDIFERTCHYIIQADPDEGKQNLLATLLQFGMARDLTRFTPIVKEAYEKNRVNNWLYGSTPEKFIAEATYWSEPEQSVEYEQSLFPLEKIVEWLLK
jgi:hypothetical protein